METLKLSSALGLEAHLGTLPVSPLWGGVDVGTRMILLGRWAGFPSMPYIGMTLEETEGGLSLRLLIFGAEGEVQ